MDLYHSKYILKIFLIFSSLGQLTCDTKCVLMPDMCTAPDEPSISAYLVTSKTLELRWKIPPNNEAEIDKYELKYCTVSIPQDDALCKSRVLLNNEGSISYTIADLSPDTYYRVELKAHNNIGSCKPSSRVFRTNSQKENTSSSQNNSKIHDGPILEPYGWKNDSYIIELAIVVDNSLFKKYKNSTIAVKEHIKSLINNLNFVFQKLNVFIALAHLEIWSDDDKIKVSEDGIKTYHNFQSYAKNLLKNEHIDTVQLMTNHKINVLSANSNGMGINAFGINQDYIASLALTIANNMGISQRNCYPSLCNKDKPLIDITWCSCTFQQMASLIKKNENFKYLKNKPIKLFDSPVCGNGFLERGEECDCGIPENCGSSCCDAKSCRINPNLLCRMGQ